MLVVCQVAAQSVLGSPTKDRRETGNPSEDVIDQGKSHLKKSLIGLDSFFMMNFQGLEFVHILLERSPEVDDQGSTAPKWINPCGNKIKVYWE